MADGDGEGKLGRAEDDGGALTVAFQCFRGG